MAWQPIAFGNLPCNYFTGFKGGRQVGPNDSIENRLVPLLRDEFIEIRDDLFPSRHYAL
jgi:hypothetical protein